VEKLLFSFSKGLWKTRRVFQVIVGIPEGFPQLRQSWHFHKARGCGNVENLFMFPFVFFYFCLFHAKTLQVHFNDNAMMNQTINCSDCYHRAFEDGFPF
jgi:hypothetical protein